jgi:hypothetical protein
MITARAITTYWDTIESNRIPMMGEALFGTRKKTGLTLEWLRAHEHLPIALNPSAFDAKPHIRDRATIDIERTKMPFFREAMEISEEDRQLLMEFANTPQSPSAREIIARMFDDAAELISGAIQIPEIMRMGLITDAQFTIASTAGAGAPVNYDYDYDPAGTWKAANQVTPAIAWSNRATADPITDIITLKRTAARKGKQLVRAIIGYDTWLDIINNEKVRAALQPVGISSVVNLTDRAVQSYFEAMTGIRLSIYDKSWADHNGTETFFYPTRGYMTLLQSGTVGTTWFGTTPEEADLTWGKSDADVSVVYTGVASCLKKESLPVNIIHWVSEIVLPTFEKIDDVYVIKYT